MIKNIETVIEKTTYKCSTINPKYGYLKLLKITVKKNHKQIINGNYTETHKIKKTVHCTETKKNFFSNKPISKHYRLVR